MAFLDLRGDGEAFVGEDQTTILLVVEISQFTEFLHHSGDGGLFDLERGGDIDHAGIALFPDQFMDSFQVILGTLAR